MLVSGKSHKLAGRKNLKFSDLDGENFISREKGSTDRNQLERLLDENKITLNRCWHSSNTEAIKNAVMHGRGITAISSMLVEKECAAGELVMLDLEGLPVNRTINLIYHKNKYISPSIGIMLDVCEKY